MKPLISIVMPYFNRPAHLKFTLLSILRSYKPLTEIIIVDDGSSLDKRAVCVLSDELSDLLVTIISIPRRLKTWTNPCIAFNRGLEQARGDIVVLQSPEVVHVDSPLPYIAANSTKSNYITMCCLTVSQQQTKLFLAEGLTAFEETVSRGIGWFHHHRFNNTNLHFLSAIRRETLKEVGLFNEQFKNGYCFEDNEFLFRIKKYGLDIDTPPITEGYGAHLWHNKSDQPKCGSAKWLANQALFNRIKEANE